MSEFASETIEKTPVKRKISFDDAFISTPSPKKVRREFNTLFKLKVISAAKETSNREQARIYNVDESVIRRWRHAEENIKVMTKTSFLKRFLKLFKKKDFYF